MNWSKQGLFAIGLACALSASGPASAAPISIGGIDVQSQYTASSGILTFDDQVNGGNVAEPGTVSTSDITGLIGGRIDLELRLDTAGFNPATDNVLNASFIGTGGFEVLIWDSTLSSVLLAFNIDFVDVTGVLPEFPPFVPTSVITLGSPLVSNIGSTTRIVVSGGTKANAVGGIGTEAALQLTISDPTPGVTFFNSNGYWSSDLTVGIGGSTPQPGINWDITVVPEPGTGLLLGLGMLVLGARRRRVQTSS